MFIFKFRAFSITVSHFPFSTFQCKIITRKYVRKIYCINRNRVYTEPSSMHVVEVQILNVNDDSVDEDIDQQEENNKMSDNIDTYVNDKIDVMDENNEKILLDNTHSVNEYKSLTCGFETNSEDDIKKHKLSVHNWCSVCFSSFSNQQKLNNHIAKKCIED